MQNSGITLIAGKLTATTPGNGVHPVLHLTLRGEVWIGWLATLLLEKQKKKNEKGCKYYGRNIGKSLDRYLIVISGITIISSEMVFS